MFLSMFTLKYYMKNKEPCKNYQILIGMIHNLAPRGAYFNLKEKRNPRDEVG